MKRLELKVGALVAASLALLGGFIVLLGNFSLRGGTRYRINFDYSGNIQSGAAVKISGIKVGKVDDVRFLGGAIDADTKQPVWVQVVAFVEDRAKDAIHANAEFYISTQGVLGEQYLEIRPGAVEKPALDASVSHTGESPPRTDLIVSKLYQFLESITDLLRDDKQVIRDFLKSGASVVRTLDEILKANQTEIGRLLVNVDNLTKEASGVLASIRSGIGDAKQIRATLANVETISAAVKRDIEPLIAKAKRALDGVDNVTSTVGPAEKKKIQQALDHLLAVADKAQGIATDAQVLVADVKRGKGTAGAFLVNQEIYDDLKELVRDLKRNPWKFFWKE
jgi:phospholipid/cholesterol/gamma-HCH transport system substrate-binding protein